MVLSSCSPPGSISISSPLILPSIPIRALPPLFYEATLIKVANDFYFAKPTDQLPLSSFFFHVILILSVLPLAFPLLGFCDTTLRCYPYFTCPFFVVSFDSLLFFFLKNNLIRPLNVRMLLLYLNSLSK